jgi:hypothetical protein
VCYREENAVNWEAGVVLTVYPKTEEVDGKTYNIVLLKNGVTVFEVEGVADQLKHRVVSVSYRSSEDEAWKDGVVVKHHLAIAIVAETFDIELEDGTKMEGLREGKNFKVNT